LGRINPIKKSPTTEKSSRGMTYTPGLSGEIQKHGSKYITPDATKELRTNHNTCLGGNRRGRAENVWQKKRRKPATKKTKNWGLNPDQQVKGTSTRQTRKKGFYRTILVKKKSVF